MRIRNYLLLVQGAFSLLEMLVSMSVLLLLGVIVAQILNSTSSATLGAEKLIDANSQARLMFDRMSLDFGAVAKNGSVNFLFQSQPGNDQLYFFSEATGYFPGNTALAASVANSFSLVGYRVSDRLSVGQRFELERLGRGLHWDVSGAPSGASNGPGSSLVYLPGRIENVFSKAIADPYNNSSNLRPTAAGADVPQWDVIGHQVFRMEFCYLLRTGELRSIPVSEIPDLQHQLTASTAPTASDDITKGYAPGSRWFDKTAGIGYVCSNAKTAVAVWRPLGWQDVQAVVVALAILDERSRKIASATALEKLADAFPDFNPSEIDPVLGQPYLMNAAWGKALEDPNLSVASGVPQTALSAVRIYQQYFFLN